MLISSCLAATMFFAASSMSVAGGKDVSAELRQRAQDVCATDAMNLCPDSLTDDGQIVACMKGKRSQLTISCRKVYDEVARALK